VGGGTSVRLNSFLNPLFREILKISTATNAAMNAEKAHNPVFVSLAIWK
jgi:hypothetical protein